MQVAALNFLDTALEKGEESLQYLYQEHSVSYLNYVRYTMQASISCGIN